MTLETFFGLVLFIAIVYGFYKKLYLPNKKSNLPKDK